MESVKAKLRSDLSQQLPPDAMTALYYSAMRGTPEGREVAFNFLVQGMGNAPVVIQWDATHGQWESAMARWLQTSYSGNDEWIELNDQTVLDLMRQFSQAPRDASIDEG